MGDAVERARWQQRRFDGGGGVERRDCQLSLSAKMMLDWKFGGRAIGAIAGVAIGATACWVWVLAAGSWRTVNQISSSAIPIGASLSITPAFDVAFSGITCMYPFSLRRKDKRILISQVRKDSGHSCQSGKGFEVSSFIDLFHPAMHWYPSMLWYRELPNPGLQFFGKISGTPLIFPQFKLREARSGRLFFGGYYRDYRRGGGLKPGGAWLPGAPGKPGGN